LIHFYKRAKMPSLLASCEELFNSKDLYEVLGAEKTANSAQIKKAYHKASLKVHPDRAQEIEREISTRKFQCISAVYTVLSDQSRRDLYDESGEVDDENDALNGNKDWEEYWRILFPKISLKDIKDFEAKYKGSKEEKEDVKKAYLDGEGSMDAILDSVMLSTVDDEDRFRTIIDELINQKLVEKFKSFTKEKKGAKAVRKRKADMEAEEAEQARKEMGLDDSDGTDAALANLIMARQQSRAQQGESFLDGLAAKYGAKPKKGAGKKK